MHVQVTTQRERFAILDAITAALGATVNKRAEPDLSDYQPTTWQHVTLPEGSISLSYQGDQKGDYVHVSGDWPRDHAGSVVTGRDAGGYGTANPSINLSAAKRPDVAAADIRRRFLPDFAPLYAKAVAIIASRAEYAAAVLTNGQALAKACGGTYELNRHGSGRHYLHGLPDGVSVTNISATSVRLELDCTLGEALMILGARSAKAKA